MSKLVLFKRIPKEGEPIEMAINLQNVIEITSKDHKGKFNTSWIKYWDGKEVRSAIIQGQPKDFIN